MPPARAGSRGTQGAAGPGLTLPCALQVHQSAQALRWMMQALRGNGFSSGEDVPPVGKQSPAPPQQPLTLLCQAVRQRFLWSWEVWCAHEVIQPLLSLFPPSLGFNPGPARREYQHPHRETQAVPSAEPQPTVLDLVPCFVGPCCLCLLQSLGQQGDGSGGETRGEPAPVPCACPKPPVPRVSHPPLPRAR